MRQAERWLMAEINTHVPQLTKEGRDTLVEWLRSTANKIEGLKCDSRWSQPLRKYSLRVGE